jgi:hypothetical protein
MAEEAGSAAARGEDELRDSIREQLADVRREVAELVACEAQLVAAAHRRDLRRWAVDIGGPMAVALVLLTAFGLANAAAVNGLSSVMPSWAAALALAAAWVAVAASLALALWIRGERGEGLRWWRALTGTTEDRLREVRGARDRAEHDLRESLERLAPDLAQEAASAVVPLASAVATGMATEVAGGVVDAGGDLLEGSDDMVEAMTEDVPGGGFVNQIWDVVLLPGRFGVRVATTVLRRPPANPDA